MSKGGGQKGGFNGEKGSINSADVYESPRLPPRSDRELHLSVPSKYIPKGRVPMKGGGGKRMVHTFFFHWWLK